MRVHYYPLLVAAILASADAAISTTTRDAISAPSTDPTEIPVKRFLRERVAANTADYSKHEERGFNLGHIDDTLQKQLKSLLKKRTNANKAFKILNVDKTAHDLLQSSQWKTFAAYVTKLDDTQADESMATALLFHLKPDNMSKMLAEAAKNPSTKELAMKLEDAQIKMWTRFTPENIFKTLKLDDAASVLFDSPQVATFAKYLEAYNKKKAAVSLRVLGKLPAEETTMLDVFKKSYGEEGLLKLIASTQGVESTLPTKMADEMLDSWLEFTKSPYSAFKVLGLDKAGDDLLSSPLLSSWVKYMGQFNEKLPSKKTTMIETFLKSYGDETLTKMLKAGKKVPSTEKLATNLETAKTALLNKWMLQGVTPDELFKNVLKLDPATMATNPNTNIWRAYYNAYEKANPGKLFSFKP